METLAKEQSHSHISAHWYRPENKRHTPNVCCLEPFLGYFYAVNTMNYCNHEKAHLKIGVRRTTQDIRAQRRWDMVK